MGGSQRAQASLKPQLLCGEEGAGKGGLDGEMGVWTKAKETDVEARGQG